MNQDLLWALLLSWGAGLNVYLTVLLAGIAGRMGWASLPPGLALLTHDVFLAAAALLFLVEFVVDKIPCVDTFWDSIHTPVRIPAGMLLAAAAAPDVPAYAHWALAAAGGLIAAGGHGAKSTLRLALNATPEPRTNWFVSLAEDLAVCLGFALFLRFPAVIAAAAALSTVLAWFAVFRLLPLAARLLLFPRPAQLRGLTWSPRTSSQPRP